MPASPPARPGASAAAPSPAPRAVPVPPPPRARALSLGRLNLLLASLFVLLVAVPPLVRWWGTPSVPPEPAGAPSSPEGGAAEARPDLDANLPRAAVVAAPQGDDPEARRAREAYTLLQQGQVAEACEHYRESLARSDRPETRRMLATCYGRLARDFYQAGRAGDAAEAYGRALDVAPERDYFIGRALALARAGDLARGQRVVEQALQTFPDDPEVLYLLADLQERQGRTKEAAETLRRLVAKDPGHARGRTLLARIEREQKFEASYWSQESPHFVVRYEGAQGIDLGRSVVDTLESAYESVGRDLGAYPKERVQVGIYTTQVLGEVIGIPAHYIRGAFDGHKLRLNLAESVAYSNDLSHLVRHEYTHLVIHLATAGRAPIWLHEGLAQVMEPRTAPRIMEISVPREFLSLSGIERLGRAMSNPVAFTAGYQLMHVAVEFLVDRGGMSGIREFLSRLGQGESTAEALRHAFGFGPEEVEARLLAKAGRG